MEGKIPETTDRLSFEKCGPEEADGRARSPVLDPEGSGRKELTTSPQRGQWAHKSYIIYYHEGHEDHEEFFNLTSLRVFRALRGDISSS